MSDYVVCHSQFLGNTFGCRGYSEASAQCLEYYYGMYEAGSCFPYVSGSVDTVFLEAGVSNDISFDWNLAEQGFKESFSLFLAIFAAYAIIKVLNFSLNGSK